MAASRIGQFATEVRSQHAWSGDENDHDSIDRKIAADTRTKPASRAPDPQLYLAQCFLRLSNLDNDVHERLGR